MQWTIDPRDLASPGVCDEAIEVYEARVIVRKSASMFLVPSSTTRDRWPDRLTPWDTRYKVIITAAPDGWKAVDDCPATDRCKHGYAAALERSRLDGVPIPDPRTVTKPRKAKRGRPLTVIPGGRT